MGLTPLWCLRDRLRRREQAPAAASQASFASADRPRADALAPQPSPEAPEAREARIAALDWATLKAAVRNCRDCGLRAGCRQTVFGVGDEQARWFVVGEAPGAEEDRLGEAFVGQAGKLLDAMLAAIGLRRGEDVYIANVLKCRPPGNRDPEPGEIATCAPYLARQLALVQPRLVLALGRFAAQTLLGTDAPLGRLRGTVWRYRGVPLVVTYHPAYLLRNLADKARAWQDLVLARRTMAALSARKDEPGRAAP